MNKYAIIESNKVINVIIKPEEPTEGTFVDITTNTLPISTDWIHTSSNFYPPLNFNKTTPSIISDDSLSTSVSCSFNRDCDPITSGDISSSEQGKIDISDVNWDSSNNILSFTATTGSNFAWGEGEHHVDFNSLHQDSFGFSWGLKSIVIDDYS
tara:strand:- start:873 stop:1334 length:462 start_codon:yes stop_codon:yes gene_type:complete